jgi:hypothetical protein
MSLAEQARKDWPSVIVAFLGAWAVVAPFLVPGTSIGTTFSNLFAGLTLLIYGVYDVYQQQIWGQRLARYWAMMAIALWLIGSPYLLLAKETIKFSNIAIGVLTLLLAGLQLYWKSEREISETAPGPGS